MGNLRSQQAEFIIAHGKELCYANNAGNIGLDILEPELYAKLISLGATFTTHTTTHRSQAHQSVCGANVLIIHEEECPAEWAPQSWATVFVLPAHTPNKKHKPWREEQHRSAEYFFWDGKWYAQTWQGRQASIMKPYTQDNDTLFQKQILGIHPELSIHWDRIFPVYAGALEEHAPYKIPHLDLVAWVEKGISKGKDKIIFSNADEALQPQSIHRVHRIIDQLDYMPKDSWFMLTATLNGTESYKQICNLIGCEPKMQIISGHRFENVVKDSMYMEYPDRSQDFTNHPHWKGREYKIGKRNKKLLCFNRMPRWQRARMVGFLFEHDLVKDSYVSFDVSDHAESFNIRQSWLVADNTDIDPAFREEPYFNNIYKNWQQLPLVLNRTVERDNPVDINDDDLQYFDNSYFSVVNETNFYHCMREEGGRPISCVHTDGVFISEKLYKPIAHRHPFVVAGIPGTLMYMRKAGYKTFSEVINEDYDSIQDDNQRLEALEKEILRLATLTDAEWLEVQKVLKPIIDHNYNHLLSIKKLNTTDYDLVGEYF